MYNYNYSISDNFRLFNEKVTADIHKLLDHYRNNPEKYEVFCEKMRKFSLELSAIIGMENPESFDSKTKEIEKYLKKEMKSL